MTAKIRKLISQDRLDEAASKIEKRWKDSPMLGEIIQQKGRLSLLKRMQHSGSSSDESLNSERNKIRIALIAFVEEIEEDSSSHEEVEKELKNNSAKQENTITQKHSGKGHNIAGDYIAGNKTTN